MTMHEGQVDLAVAEVAAIVADWLGQRPGYPAPVVRPIVSSGTVAGLFRIDDDLVARFPLLPAADEERRADIRAEMAHARTVAAHVSLEVPVPVHLGAPDDRYPGWWSVWRWLPGDTARRGTVPDLGRFAADLAGFVREYRAIPHDGAPRSTARGCGPLADQDDWVRYSLARSGHLIDTDAVLAVWHQCREAPEYAGPPVFLHSDLIPANLLVRHGRLAAVIDLGTPHVGDPAADLTPAWTFLDRDSRRVWRAELAPDDATWARSKGWALAQAIGALPYYEHSNPAMAAASLHTLTELIADAGQPAP